MQVAETGKLAMIITPSKVVRVYKFANVEFSHAAHFVNDLTTLHAQRLVANLLNN